MNLGSASRWEPVELAVHPRPRRLTNRHNIRIDNAGYIVERIPAARRIM